MCAYLQGLVAGKELEVSCHPKTGEILDLIPLVIQLSHLWMDLSAEQEIAMPRDLH